MSNPDVVVVTGASGGIGRATVRKFAEHGCHLGLLARGRAGLDAAQREVEQAGGRAIALPTDVADHAAVEAAAARVDGDEFADDAAFWRAIREQTHSFFAGAEPLWRLAVPSTTPPLELGGSQFLEWNGGLRWLRSAASANDVRAAAKRAGGHATLFRAHDKAAGAFSPLDPVLLRLHRQLKNAFDPAGIFNPGRLYAEL
jgi:NAD(P)-dependent dehydrogenase (short-subunit alcohol dehydrogenase family)